MGHANRGHPILAVGVDGQTAVFQSLLLFGAVLMATLIAVVVLLFVRQRIRGREREGTDMLSLDQLRRLRDRGELTIAEYDTLREHTIETMRERLGSESGANAR